MTVRRSPARTACLAGLAAAALLSTAACGAGLSPQTYRPRDEANATNGSVHDIALRDVSVQAPPDESGYPAGADAPLSLVLVDQGSQPDQLVSASSDVAAEVGLTTAPSRQGQVRLPPGQPVQLGLVLRGLSRPLHAGDYVTLQLTFADNGQGNVLVPVSVVAPTASASATPTG